MRVSPDGIPETANVTVAASPLRKKELVGFDVSAEKTTASKSAVNDIVTDLSLRLHLPHAISSNAFDTRSSFSSSKPPHTNCTPTGRPSFVKPAGTDAAHTPASDDGMV